MFMFRRNPNARQSTVYHHAKIASLLFSFFFAIGVINALKQGKSCWGSLFLMLNSLGMYVKANELAINAEIQEENNQNQNDAPRYR